jgi:hypothetical protein
MTTLGACRPTNSRFISNNMKYTAQAYLLFSLFALEDLARDPLEFIARTGAFYVRELPGSLDDEETVALAAALVQCKVFRCAS